MLETDCIIPKHVPIPHDPVTLYGNARAVRALQQDGFGKWGIIKKLHISEEAYNDAIFEINKAKAVSEIIEEEEMARGVKLTAETVSRIREMKDNGNTMREIAEECNCGVSTVNHICNGKKSQINEEFDNAINQMIAESDKPAEIEQVAEPVVMTEEHTVETVPDVVMQAVADKIDTLSAVLSDNLLTIKKMQQDNENLRSELAILYGWRAEHEGAKN